MVEAIGDVAEAAWFPKDAVIQIEQKGGSIQTITTRVTNFSDGGGGKETESIPHFGDAFLTVIKPQEDFEVSFDIDITDTRYFQIISDDVTSFSGSIAGSTISTRSGGEQNEYKIKIEWHDAVGSDGYKLIYYNARGVSLEKESSAEDRLMGTINFTLSPTDTVGSGQKVEVETSALYDPAVGSIVAGSYAVIESDFDTEFGFTSGGMLF